MERNSISRTERTMEKRAGKMILVVLSMILASKSIGSCANIFSQIDFDSRENERSTNSSGLKAFLNLNDVNGHVPTRNSKPTDFGSNDQIAFARSESLKRSNFMHGDSTKHPTVTNNVRIIVNGNESEPGLDSCKSGVCEVSVSSRQDEEGNIVTNVHLSVITKLETVNDIPVIDGLGGVKETRDPSDFRRLNPIQRPIYLHNDIPQIQTQYQNGEPWYQGRRTFQRPQPIWRSRYPEEPTGKRFQNGGRRPSKIPIVDDKIEAPLSKTHMGNE